MSNRRLPIAALGAALAASAFALGAAAQSPAPASPGPAGSVIPTSPMASEAAGSTITVIGTDYAFGGLPSSVPAGTALAFQNDGAEVHELLVARKNDGVTESWDELLALPDEEVIAKVTILGPLVASPGEAGANVDGSGATLTLDVEGSYIALCFVPQGMTAFPDEAASPDPSASFGPPHFVLGMRQEFSVTAAGSSPGPMPSAMPMASHAAPMASPAGSPAA
jgi:hypothetical protein